MIDDNNFLDHLIEHGTFPFFFYFLIYWKTYKICSVAHGVCSILPLQSSTCMSSLNQFKCYIYLVWLVAPVALLQQFKIIHEVATFNCKICFGPRAQAWKCSYAYVMFSIILAFRLYGRGYVCLAIWYSFIYTRQVLPNPWKPDATLFW